MSRSTTLLPVPKVAATCRQLAAQPGLPFAEHLPAKLVHTTFRDLGHFFRQRIFTPAVTLWTFLSQVLDPDHSCRQAVARLLAHRVALGHRPCSADTGAYCKARARLPEDGLAELTRSTGRQLAHQAPVAWRWHGRSVKIVDGTGVSMPDTPDNRKAYPPPRQNQADTGVADASRVRASARQTVSTGAAGGRAPAWLPQPATQHADVSPAALAESGHRGSRD